MGHEGAEQGLTEHSHAGLALMLICAVQMMVILDGTIVNIALPSIQHQLHFSAPGLEWVITAYALTFGGLLLLGGRSGDLFGRRRMFTIGVVIFTAASLLGGFATDQLWLIAARVAQGVGGAIASPTALALIQNTYPEGPRRSRAMGVYAAMSGAGGSLGLLLGGILTDIASWRWVLFVNVPIGLTVAILAPRVLGTTPTRHGRLDLPGALSVTLGMASLVYGLSRAATAGWADHYTLTALGAAVVLLATFITIESQEPSRVDAVAHLLGPQPGRFLRDHALSRRGHVRHLLLHHPVRPEHPGLQPAQGRGRLPSHDHRHRRHRQRGFTPGRQDRTPPAHDRRPAPGHGGPPVAVVRRGARRLHLDHRAAHVARHRHGFDLRAPDPHGHVAGASG